jgi:hypothetical protein
MYGTRVKTFRIYPLSLPIASASLACSSKLVQAHFGRGQAASAAGAHLKFRASKEDLIIIITLLACLRSTPHGPHVVCSIHIIWRSIAPLPSIATSRHTVAESEASQPQVFLSHTSLEAIQTKLETACNPADFNHSSPSIFLGHSNAYERFSLTAQTKTSDGVTRRATTQLE